MKQSEPLAEDWQPTPENINALPEPLRHYVRALESMSDPAGLAARERMRRASSQRRFRRAAFWNGSGDLASQLFQDQAETICFPTVLHALRELINAPYTPPAR